MSGPVGELPPSAIEAAGGGGRRQSIQHMKRVMSEQLLHTTGEEEGGLAPLQEGAEMKRHHSQASLDTVSTANMTDADGDVDGSNDLVVRCSGYLNELGTSASGGEQQWSSQEHQHQHQHQHQQLQQPQQEKKKRGSDDFFEYTDPGAFMYRNLFFDEEHHNFVGVDPDLGPLIISILRELDVSATGDGKKCVYHSILRTAEGKDVRSVTPEAQIRVSSRFGKGQPPSAVDVIRTIAPRVQANKLKYITERAFAEKVLSLDEQSCAKTYKVGVLYCRAGQSTEDEMYGNELMEPLFAEFMDLIANKVRLKGYTGFRAGLDVKSDTTGTHSYAATIHDCEVMFHVSPLLPFGAEANSGQHLQRKRHIGNDIITIVFQEPGSKPFSPKTIRSHFQHVFIVVRAETDGRYRVAVSRYEDIPNFGPAVAEGGLFARDAAFARWLLTKVVNSENAAYKSKKFSTMSRRTRVSVLTDMVQTAVASESAASTKEASKTLKKKKSLTPATSGGLASYQSSLLGGSGGSGGGGPGSSSGSSSRTWRVKVRGRVKNSTINRTLKVSREGVALLDDNTQATVQSWDVPDITFVQQKLYGVDLFYKDSSGEEVLLTMQTREGDEIYQSIESLRFSFTLINPSGSPASEHQRQRTAARAQSMGGSGTTSPYATHASRLRGQATDDGARRNTASGASPRSEVRRELDRPLSFVAKSKSALKPAKSLSALDDIVTEDDVKAKADAAAAADAAAKASAMAAALAASKADTQQTAKDTWLLNKVEELTITNAMLEADNDVLKQEMEELKEANQRLRSENDEIRMKLAHTNLGKEGREPVRRSNSDVVTHL